jgi:hypothetical protein
MPDLTTIDRVKRLLSVEAGDTDGARLLADFVTQESARFVGWVARPIIQASYTDTADGDNSTKLTLKNYPVTAIASVTINDVAVPVRPTKLADGWVQSGDAVKLVGFRFDKGTENVEVQYTAGYASNAIPDDIQAAVAEMVAWRYREKDRFGQSSVNQAGAVTSFKLDDAPASVKSTVANYARVGF